MAGLLPSTGSFQLNDVSRRGTKFAWKYAMPPAASAYTVLLDELALTSSVLRKEAKSRALVRVHDSISAFTGWCIRRMLVPRWPERPMIGPCRVR